MDNGKNLGINFKKPNQPDARMTEIPKDTGRESSYETYISATIVQLKDNEVVFSGDGVFDFQKDENDVQLKEGQKMGLHG